MKNRRLSAILPFILMFASACLTLTATAANPNLKIPAIKESGQISPEEAKTLLIGEWIIAPIQGFKPGSLTVQDKSHYSMTRWHDATVGATLKGEYKFDTSQEPFAIDFCLEECGRPGSEWTTQVGILRFISRDEMEIQFDPSGKRPSEFTPKEDDPYFTKLMRKKTE